MMLLTVKRELISTRRKNTRNASAIELKIETWFASRMPIGRIEDPQSLPH
jgi:hypothetical protein